MLLLSFFKQDPAIILGDARRHSEPVRESAGYRAQASELFTGSLRLVFVYEDERVGFPRCRDRQRLLN